MSYYDDDYNQKHNFTFRLDSNDGERHLEMNCNEIYLGDIFARFKEFLQGCGYEINGDIDVIEYNSAQDEQQKFDFSNIPNNNWPFGEIKKEEPKSQFGLWDEHDYGNYGSAPIYQWKNEPLPSLTTKDLIAIQSIDLSSFKSIDLSSLTVTDLSTLTTHAYNDWTGINKYPTMAPLTTEQIQSWSMEMPGTLGSAKVKF